MSDVWGTAQAQVATKYDPQQNALQRQLDMAKASTVNNEASLNQYGQQGRDIIGQSYGNLYNWLDYGKATQQQQLGQGVAATNAAYDQSISDIQGWQGKSRDYLNNMAAQLGQSGAGLQANAELEGLVNTQLGRASAARTNYGTSLSDWMQKMGSIADMGISSAHQSEAQGRSAFEADLLQALGQNKLAGTQQETDLMNKLSDIMGLRQSDLIAMYNELAAAEWEHQFQQAQLDQQAAEANADLAYKYSALDADNANQAANRSASGSSDALGWAKLQWDKDQFGQTSAASQAQQDWENRFNTGNQDIERQKLHPGIDRQALLPSMIDEAAFRNKDGSLNTGNVMRWLGGDDSVFDVQSAAARSGGGSGWRTAAAPLDWIGHQTVNEIRNTPSQLNTLGRAVTGKNGWSFWS